jgi:flagellar hook-associated protein 3 FlgL
MRVSTAGFHRSTLEALNSRQADLSKTQGQIASGKRVNTPSDDPSAAVHILQLQRALAESEQYGRNADTATNRLSLEEQSLAAATSILQRIRDLTVQANSASVADSDRVALATEIDQQFNALTDLANQKDASGEYLFSGTATLTQPFASSNGTVSYAGNTNVRMVQTSATQKIADGHSGYELFMNIQQGNGTFTATPGGANTGSGAIQRTALTNSSAWTPGTYTITFTSATAYQVTDSASTVISSGTFATGDTVSFNGAQVTLDGAPATGDTFTVAPAGKQDMFTTVNNLRNTLRSNTTTPAQKAQVTSQLGDTLTQLDNALAHVGDIRSEVGARMNALDDVQSNREDAKVTLESSLSDLKDLDYASAITKLTLQQTGLQAAQASYARLSQLSLFDYLR